MTAIPGGGRGASVELFDSAGNALGVAANPLIATATLDPTGLATSANQTSQITQETAAAAALGTTAGTKVVTDANGTVQQYLRGLVSLWVGGLAAGTAIIGKVGIDQTAGQNVVTDGGTAFTSVWGVAGVPFTSGDQHSAVASVSDAPTSGKKLCIDDLIFSTDTAMNVTFKEETSGTVMFGPWYVPANTTLQVTLRGKKKLATADKKLQVITSVAGNITVQAGYHSES